MKKKKIIFLGVIITLILIIYFSIFNNYSLTDYNRRRLNSKISQQFLPDINDLPKYRNIFYNYRNNIILFPVFYAKSLILVVYYEDVIFQIEKEKINNLKYIKNIIYEKNEITNDIYYLIPEYEFTINSYQFKVLEEEQESYYQCPKYIGIIAISYEKRSIAYMYFEDQDIDYISKNKHKNEMEIFIKNFFKYKW